MLQSSYYIGISNYNLVIVIVLVLLSIIRDIGYTAVWDNSGRTRVTVTNSSIRNVSDRVRKTQMLSIQLDTRCRLRSVCRDWYVHIYRTCVRDVTD
jgi:hypothetical protein